MTAQLNHTIVPARDKQAAAEFLAAVLDFMDGDRGFYFLDPSGHTMELLTPQ